MGVTRRRWQGAPGRRRLRAAQGRAGRSEGGSGAPSTARAHCLPSAPLPLPTHLVVLVGDVVADEVLLHQQLLHDGVVDRGDGAAVAIQEVLLGVSHRRRRVCCGHRAGGGRYGQSAGLDRLGGSARPQARYRGTGDVVTSAAGCAQSRAAQSCAAPRPQGAAGPQLDRSAAYGRAWVAWRAPGTRCLAPEGPEAQGLRVQRAPLAPPIRAHCWPSRLLRLTRHHSDATAAAAWRERGRSAPPVWCRAEASAIRAPGAAAAIQEHSFTLTWPQAPGSAPAGCCCCREARSAWLARIGGSKPPVLRLWCGGFTNMLCERGGMLGGPSQVGTRAREGGGARACSVADRGAGVPMQATASERQQSSEWMG
jgi:hypothetical protein